MSHFIDIHRHNSISDHIAIIDISNEESPHCRDSFCSYGIHPLCLTQHYQDKLKQLYQLAEHGEIIALGECGFDHRSSASIVLQRDIFKKQVAISEHFGLPLLIHCVKGSSELLEMYKQSRPQQPWIIHGFNNNRNILKQFIQKGFYISIGASICNPYSNSYQLIPEIPADKLLLESDEACISIEDIYHQAALRIGTTLDELKTQIEINFKRIFYDKKQLVGENRTLTWKG